MISILFSTLIATTVPQQDVYYCRLSWFEEGSCIYQCQNGYERFTWSEEEAIGGCKLMKKLYKT